MLQRVCIVVVMQQSHEHLRGQVLEEREPKQTLCSCTYALRTWGRRKTENQQMSE